MELLSNEDSIEECASFPILIYCGSYKIILKMGIGNLGFALSPSVLL